MSAPAPPALQSGGWKVWIDTGGTFTDCLAVDPQGRLRRVKVLSSSALRGRVEALQGPRTVLLSVCWQAPPGLLEGATFHLLGGPWGQEAVAVRRCDSSTPGRPRLELAAPPPRAAAPGVACELRFPEEAPVLAARLVTGTAAAAELPPLALRLATTRGTNALLTRHGGRVALFITRGLGDLLAIGTQQRPELFTLHIEKPRPLYEAVVEVDERLAADGSVIRPLDDAVLEALASRAGELLDQGVDCAAVALLHSYRNPRHEERLAALLRRTGFAQVVSSAELAPLIQLLPRAETAVVEAYLAPVIRGYLDAVAMAVPRGSLHVMTSAGGLVRSTEFRAKDSLLSGPAGGVVGAARAGLRSGFRRILAFDMGGTSTDVGRFDGDYEYTFEQRVGDARLVLPALAIESVAAGGGSVCSFDGDRLRVGPESAGARPGPACYGAGGPLTLTDVNLLLGRLDGERFEIPIEPRAAEAAADAVARAVGKGVAREVLLEGFLAIADERMADAMREISVRRGYDPRDHALVAFGGAGAQHACAVAELLGAEAVLVPEDSGLLSAHGLGAAVVERFVHRQVLRPLEEVRPGLAAMLAEMESEARRAVAREGVAAAVEVRRRILNLRFAGQDSTLALEPRAGALEAGLDVGAAFYRAYRERYGYRPEDRAVELESLRVVASAEPPPMEVEEPLRSSRLAAPQGRRRVHLGGRWQQVSDYERSRLAPGESFPGPALVFERHSTTVVGEGWHGAVDGAGALLLRRRSGDPGGR